MLYIKTLKPVVTGNLPQLLIQPQRPQQQQQQHQHRSLLLIGFEEERREMQRSKLFRCSTK